MTKRLLLLLAIVIALMALGLIVYPMAYSVIGTKSIVITAMLLFLYAVIAVGISNVSSQKGIIALEQAWKVGLFAGLLFIGTVSLENFVDLGSTFTTISTLIFMASIFLSFGAASFLTTKKTGKFGFGILSSLITAVMSVCIALIFGFAINFLFTHRLEQNLIHSAEFTRSHVRDIRTFTMFNTFESASTHLLEAPIIAFVFGVISGGIGKLFHKA